MNFPPRHPKVRPKCAVYIPKQGKNLFFHFKYFVDFGCPKTKSTRLKRKKKRCQNKLVVANQGVSTKTGGWWTVNTQKKAATLVTNRGMFSANCTKHLIVDLVKFDLGKFFIQCLLKLTDTRLFVLLFFRICSAIFLVCLRLCLIPFLMIDFPDVKQTHRVLRSENHGFRALFS